MQQERFLQSFAKFNDTRKKFAAHLYYNLKQNLTLSFKNYLPFPKSSTGYEKMAHSPGFIGFYFIYPGLLFCSQN
jgi:hypothetical protein